MVSVKAVGLFAALACVTWLSGTATAQGVKVGDKVPDYEFHKAMTNGDGRMALGDMRGSPILIDWWGHH